MRKLYIVSIFLCIFAAARADVAADRLKLVADSIARRDSLLLADAPMDAIDAESRGVKLGEVVVTARESRGVTSASLIDRQAMAHLQPSSFTDLIELLPGSVSKDPNMGGPNLINLRQAPQISNDTYNTSSLGTSFVIDGVPVNTSAEMQSTSDANRTSRLTAGKGVDMRALSTDDIESVEIVRGIPSAEYGELTSGLVKIRRKQGATGLEARFKADMQSQLFYIGKGFNMPAEGWSINLSANYLDSKVDPRDSRENFKRAIFSARSNLQRPVYGGRRKFTWDTSLTYTGTFERDHNDPDLTVNNTIDYFNNDVNAIAWNNSLVLLNPSRGFFNSLSLTTGLSYAYEHLSQEKTVAPTRIYPLPVATIPGDHYVGFLPMLYIADLDVYGKPLTAYAKLASRFRYGLGHLGGWLKAGAEWNYSKNFGRGQVYDLERPITAGNTSRPRPFRDIPHMSQLSVYVENESEMRLDNHTAYLQLGLRETQLLGLDSRYYLSGRPYFDPRANLKWVFPYINVASNPLVLELAAGVGLHSKMPVAAYLYPDNSYIDFVQLNYYHNNEQYRTMNVRTYVEERVNYDIRAARNLKWEVRADASYMGNRLSVTYFRENMKDAFRMASEVTLQTYHKYDASGWNPSAGGAPTIDRLPYTVEKYITMLSRPTNSSQVKKEGVEFTFSTRRFPAIRTRLTVNGAWFRTTLSNSEGLWYKPGIIVDGKELQYAGFYDDKDGMVYKSFNTNFTFDTDIPRLKLNISLSVQNMWYTSNRSLWRSGVPQYITDAEGNIFPWEAAMATDPYLRQLLRTYSSTAFDEIRVPLATQFNLKATKSLWNDRIGIALYVNRLISITPDYERYGTIQRRYTDPYFGMELNLKL